MEEIINSIISTYYFAIVAIIFGIWKLRDTIKNTPANIPNSSPLPRESFRVDIFYNKIYPQKNTLIS